MSNFFYRRLNFYDKTGSPLNFEYIGATGPSELDLKFTYITNSSVSSSGACSVAQLDNNTSPYIDLNPTDLNGYYINSWATEANDYILNGADVFLYGRIAGQNEFSAKITSVVDNSTYYRVNFETDSVSGQELISLDNQIYFNTVYTNRPGGYFKGNIYFDPVSSGLYENQQIFIVQLLESSGNFEYGLPHTGVTGATAGVWRTRWYNDSYGETDVSEILFTYKIEDQLEGGEGKPLIVSYPNIVYSVDADPTDSLTGNGYVSTSTVSSEALSINVAINATDLASNIYERKLIVEDISSGTPQKVIEIDFYGEIIGEDERFDIMLRNIGRAFYQEDSIILRDHDPNEPLPNYLEINEKRKELLVAGEEIFPYLGSYKGLINAIKFFGYQDLRIKEYWLNLQYQSLKLESPLQQNAQFLRAIKNQQKGGYSQSYQIGDVLDNPNSGKYKLVQTYGPDGNGNYVLDVSSEETLLPSRTYKKTSLFGLYYDINKTTGYDSDFGYPEVIDSFQFTQEEVLIKMFALKERLKRDYLPLNARIIDITGEGIYFNVYNTKAWTDVMERPDIESGFYTDIKVTPDFGFLEDLRNFSTRPLANSIQTPSSYNNYYKIESSVGGGTGSAMYFSGIPATGPNPLLTVTAGKTYEFSFDTDGFDLYITTDSSLNQSDPIGLTGNGATAGSSSIVWYVNPQQTSPVYYYSSPNKALLNGVINVLPSELSDLGNIIDPLSFQQNYSANQNQSLISSISEFYTLKQNSDLVELGDGKYDPPAYIDPVTGLQYQTPIGMPIILELIRDIWSWDELNISWSSLLIPSFKVGSRVLYKPTNIYGTVTSVDYSTGIYDILLDNSTSSDGILTGNTETMYITYQLENDFCFTNWLHSNYYSKVVGNDNNCNPDVSKNVAVRFGPEFPCLNQPGYIPTTTTTTSNTTTTTTLNPPCWENGFQLNIVDDVNDTSTQLYYYNSGMIMNGQPVFVTTLDDPYASNIYWTGNEWVFIELESPEIPTTMFTTESPIGDFSLTGAITFSGFTSCGFSNDLCLTICPTPSTCYESSYIQVISGGTTVYLSTNNNSVIYYDIFNDDWALEVSNTVVGKLTGMTQTELPFGSWVTNTYDSIDSIRGECPPSCTCITFTAQDTSQVNWMDCNGLINYQTLLSGESIDVCVANNNYNLGSGSVTVGACTQNCTTGLLNSAIALSTSNNTNNNTNNLSVGNNNFTQVTTTTTACPVCNIETGFWATKFKILAQKVITGQRPDPSSWKIIDFTPQIQSQFINGYVTLAAG